MVIHNKIIAIAFFASILLCSCGNNDTENIDDIPTETNSVKLDSQKISAQNIFNTISSREIILELIKEGKSEYNSQILNNPDNLHQYVIESSRALNLGVYGADLNTANIYDQAQESMLFFKCVNILAKNIGVSDSFDENMGDRMTANQSNRDSTLSIISQAFTKADATLRKNGRNGASALLVAGLWIEGLYIACETAKETKHEAMIKEIYQQKESLSNLIILLKGSELTADVQFILPELKDIKKIMTDKTDIDFTITALKVLDVKINQLRTKITSLK